jgi:hypothetical protein
MAMSLNDLNSGRNRAELRLDGFSIWHIFTFVRSKNRSGVAEIEYRTRIHEELPD